MDQNKTSEGATCSEGEGQRTRSDGIGQGPEGGVGGVIEEKFPGCGSGKLALQGIIQEHNIYADYYSMHCSKTPDQGSAEFA